ncbi:MAG: HAMP domain-containing histidine kinase [Clostridia bacterium]|nr:HAMP domain-containing histidine kinase [Clostridia bacterium]
MKKRSNRQKRKLILSVLCVLLAAWVVVEAIFCFAVIRLEMNNTLKDEMYSNEVLVSNLDDTYLYPEYYDSSDGMMYREIEFYRLKKDIESDSFTYDTNTQLVITYDCGFEGDFDTDKGIFVSFSGMFMSENDDITGGVIDYEAFINSFKEEELKEIKDYLSRPIDANGKRYYLICTEFFYEPYKLVIIPQSLDLVFRENENSWHMSSDIVKSYSLNVEKNEGFFHFKMDTDRSNVIPTEFLFGNFSSSGLVNLPNDTKERIEYIENSDFLENAKLYSESPFKCVYVKATPIEVVSDLTVSIGTDGDYDFLREVHTGYFIYAKRIDIFEACKDFLFLGTVGIFAFFLIIGALMSIMLLKNLDTREKEELKRREITNALAHDIKTPLFIISGYAQNLKENINPEKHEHYICRIIDRSKEVNELVHKMLDLSKLDSFEFTLSKEELDLAELVNGVLSDYTNLTDNKSIKLTVDSPAVISADRSLMSRIVTNLMENAVAYSDIQTVITVQLSDKFLSISNVTSSVTEAELSRLTEPYYRGDKNRNSKGNGLGLSTVKSIAEMHGFRFESSLDKNVITFTVYF